jgi:hypothetical protein
MALVVRLADRRRSGSGIDAHGHQFEHGWLASWFQFEQVYACAIVMRTGRLVVHTFVQHCLHVCTQLRQQTRVACQCIPVDVE